MGSPVTDGEQWSDELDEADNSPQALGYAPLDYQVLDGEPGDFDHENDPGEGANEDEDEDAASSQQPDVRCREGEKGEEEVDHCFCV